MNLEKTIRNLEGRGFRVSHFEKAEDAAAHIAGQVSGKTVGIGGSKTIEALGLFELLPQPFSPISATTSPAKSANENSSASTAERPA